MPSMHERTVCYALLAPAEAVRTADAAIQGFAGIAYSGGVVPNYGMAGDMAIDLGSIDLPRAEVPILLNHDPNKIVGRATVVNDGKQLTITSGTFSTVTEYGKQVAGLMGEGHPWQYSVGIAGKARGVKRDTPTKLNGREMALDTLLHKTRLLEVSFVPSGADPHAHAARLSAQFGLTTPDGDENMEQDIVAAKARITELEGQVTALSTDLATAQTKLKAAAVESRNKAITTLFGEKAELTDAQLAAYRTMSDEQFDVVSAALSTVRAPQDESLFTQQATSGKNHLATVPIQSTKVPSGYAIDPESEQLHAKVVAHQLQHPGIDYVTALSAITSGV